MGRRSINTTKSGKYMNPTDQARKEARKRELKKNKRQRQMVRAAVLKGKDPVQIIEEMEKIDEMEFNVYQASPLNEKVLKEKRKKLKETLDRVLKLYDKDDPEQWAELKRREIDYERRRNKLVAHYEAVKHAQSVQIDEIPLPSHQISDNSAVLHSIPAQIPLPTMTSCLSKSTSQTSSKTNGILKRVSMQLTNTNRIPPGVPPGPPPSLSDDEEDFSESSFNYTSKSKMRIRFSDDPFQTIKVKDTDDIETDDLIILRAPGTELEIKPKPTSLQQRMLALSGQNIDEFMKEMEVVQRKREQDRTNEPETTLNLEQNLDNSSMISSLNSSNAISMPPPPPGLFTPIDNREIMSSLRSSSVLPPSNMPMRFGLRLPPGPPPGLPPRFMRLPMAPRIGMQIPLNNITSTSQVLLPQLQSNVLSAAPQIIVQNDRPKQSATTIMAKPQIRNLSADVTRFVPSTLRIKRDDKKSKIHDKSDSVIRNVVQEKLKEGQTKDDAYYQFMKEMQGLL